MYLIFQVKSKKLINEIDLNPENIWHIVLNKKRLTTIEPE